MGQRYIRFSITNDRFSRLWLHNDLDDGAELFFQPDNQSICLPMVATKSVKRSP